MTNDLKSKPKRPRSVETDDTFGEVLRIFQEEKVHRLYIVDASGMSFDPRKRNQSTNGHLGHPIGFINLIDVIARL